MEKELYRKNINISDNRNNTQFHTPSQSNTQNNQNSISKFHTSNGKELETPSLLTQNLFTLLKTETQLKSLHVKNLGGNPKLVHT